MQVITLEITSCESTTHHFNSGSGIQARRTSVHKKLLSESGCHKKAAAVRRQLLPQKSPHAV